MDKLKILLKYSNPQEAQENAYNYLGKDALLYVSTRKSRKYMIRDPSTGKMIHFGSIEPPYEDNTKHHNEQRRQHYLKRSNLIKGDWRDNPYSPNNLSRNILWGG
jgi:hypothetical protein